MSYAWDVFVSYRRLGPASEWTHKVFVPTLRNWLPQYHGPSSRVFLDVDEDPSLTGIPVGVSWEQALQDALQRSRCLIAVMSAEYFTSEWCLAEFHTMLQRQEHTKSQLVIPVRFADGTFYPDVAKALQHIDFEPYNTYRSAKQTPKKFVNEVKKLSEVLHGRLSAVPQWSEAWPVVTPAKPNEQHVPKPGF